MGEVRELPDLTLRYAEHTDGVIDVHLPGTTAEPADVPIVLIHGGFWRQAYDRTHTRPMARALADRGHVVATPEYRRVGGGGPWPSAYDDLRSAVLDLSVMAETFPWSDPVLVGHSAGGHLALLLAGVVEPIRGVVGLAPVADLAAARCLRLGSDAVTAFVGDNLTEADPMHLPPRPGVPVTLVHGTLDDTVPISQSQAYVKRYPQARLHELDCGHYEVIDPQSRVWPFVVRAIEGENS